MFVSNNNYISALPNESLQAILTRGDRATILNCRLVSKHFKNLCPLISNFSHIKDNKLLKKIFHRCSFDKILLLRATSKRFISCSDKVLKSQLLEKMVNIDFLTNYFISHLDKKNRNKMVFSIPEFLNEIKKNAVKSQIKIKHFVHYGLCSISVHPLKIGRQYLGEKSVYLTELPLDGQKWSRSQKIFSDSSFEIWSPNLGVGIEQATIDRNTKKIRKINNKIQETLDSRYQHLRKITFHYLKGYFLQRLQKINMEAITTFNKIDSCIHRLKDPDKLIETIGIIAKGSKTIADASIQMLKLKRKFNKERSAAKTATLNDSPFMGGKPLEGKIKFWETIMVRVPGQEDVLKLKDIDKVAHHQLITCRDLDEYVKLMDCKLTQSESSLKNFQTQLDRLPELALRKAEES